jgi:hypothetical protein
VYGWLWGRLPGSRAVKSVEALALFVVVVLVLFLWVFPWLEPRLPFNDVTVDQPATSTSAPSTGGQTGTPQVSSPSSSVLPSP